MLDLKKSVDTILFLNHSFFFCSVHTLIKIIVNAIPSLYIITSIQFYLIKEYCQINFNLFFILTFFYSCILYLYVLGRIHLKTKRQRNIQNIVISVFIQWWNWWKQNANRHSTDKIKCMQLPNNGNIYRCRIDIAKISPQDLAIHG